MLIGKNGCSRQGPKSVVNLEGDNDAKPCP